MSIMSSNILLLVVLALAVLFLYSYADYAKMCKEIDFLNLSKKERLKVTGVLFNDFLEEECERLRFRDDDF